MDIAGVWEYSVGLAWTQDSALPVFDLVGFWGEHYLRCLWGGRSGMKLFLSGSAVVGCLTLFFGARTAS
jgi:hypothetical protein